MIVHAQHKALSTSSSSGPGLLSCWWKATLIVYFIGCIIGLLDNGASGLLGQMLIGLLHAPVLGFFFGGLYWLIRR